MCLHPSNNNPTTNNPSSNGGVVTPVQFSHFHYPVTNTRPGKSLTLWEVYQLIKSNQYQPQTMILRTFTNRGEANDYKSKWFDYVTFSGTFTSRKNEALIQHSNLMVIDIDHIDDVKVLKAKLLEDKYFETELSFNSPSNDGYKWVVSIDTNLYTHTEWFLGIEKYIKDAYDLKIDASGKDVSRACYLPYDSEVYINPKHIKA